MRKSLFAEGGGLADAEEEAAIIAEGVTEAKAIVELYAEEVCRNRDPILIPVRVSEFEITKRNINFGIRATITAAADYVCLKLEEEVRSADVVDDPEICHGPDGWYKNCY